MQPMLASLTGSQFGIDQSLFMQQLPHLSGLLSLQVDGLLPGDEGGTVRIRKDGRVGLRYPFSDGCGSLAATAVGRRGGWSDEARGVT
jgi:hypothetical protein